MTRSYKGGLVTGNLKCSWKKIKFSNGHEYTDRNMLVKQEWVIANAKKYFFTRDIFLQLKKLILIDELHLIIQEIFFVLSSK